MKNSSDQKISRVVLAACVLFNVSIGVLYAWSVISSRLTAPEYDGGWGWSSSQAGLPYTVAIIVFATAMLIGGRLQDKIGPRRVVTVGGALSGLGVMLSGLVGNSVIGITLCFGVIAAIGMGFGYGCVTPPALKWFHPSKKGLISGLIVGGFGLSAVYYAPLTSMLLDNFGIGSTLLYLGIGILVVSVFFARLIKNPPTGYVPDTPAKLKQKAAKTLPTVDYTFKQMLKTRRFYMMFLMFVLASSVGLMIIGNISRIAQNQIGITDATVLAMLVSFLAVTNTVGRVIGGMMSDKIGRINSLYVLLVLYAVNMGAFMLYNSLPMLIIGIIGIGFCFGTLLSVFPALTADQYGLKNFGANYGIMFMAWGLSGVVAPVIANYLYDINGNFYTAYIICAVMMVAMIFVNYLVQKDIAKADSKARGM